MATKSDTFSADEKAAIKERAKELKAQAKRDTGLKDVLAAIEKLPEEDRGIATRLHEIITAAAPELEPKTWYGMPGYARDGAILVFFQGAAKFKTRYSTLGFNDIANLDDGNVWPSAFAITKLTKADEDAITKLVKRAVS